MFIERLYCELCFYSVSGNCFNFTVTIFSHLFLVSISFWEYYLYLSFVGGWHLLNSIPCCVNFICLSLITLTNVLWERKEGDMKHEKTGTLGGRDGEGLCVLFLQSNLATNCCYTFSIELSLNPEAKPFLTLCWWSLNLVLSLRILLALNCMKKWWLHGFICWESALLLFDNLISRICKKLGGEEALGKYVWKNINSTMNGQ